MSSFFKFVKFFKFFKVIKFVKFFKFVKFIKFIRFFKGAIVTRCTIVSIVARKRLSDESFFDNKGWPKSDFGQPLLWGWLRGD